MKGGAVSGHSSRKASPLGSRSSALPSTRAFESSLAWMTSRPISKSLSLSETLEAPGRLPARARPACGPRRFLLRFLSLPRLLHAPTRARQHHPCMVLFPGESADPEPAIARWSQHHVVMRDIDTNDWRGQTAA
jgi:hypothetical protein